MKDKCKICGKELLYGGSESPMLKEHVWETIVAKYGLTRYEICAETNFSRSYRSYLKIKKLNNNVKFNDSQDYHLYICKDCMERALGRHLTYDDLVDHPCDFNSKFIERL